MDVKVAHEKTTDELMNDIMQDDKVEKFLAENQGEMQDMSLSAYLQFLLKEKGVKKADVFRKAELVGSNYGYEIFRSDQKKPSRDILLMICLAFPLTVEEAQQALRRAGLAILYPRDLRDAYVLYGLKNQIGVENLNALLIEKRLKPLA